MTIATLQEAAGTARPTLLTQYRLPPPEMSRDGSSLAETRRGGDVGENIEKGRVCSD